MATPLTSKLIMRNTTKMSLNERFTAYRTEAQTLADSYRQKITQHRQASSANLRLAQQMANRPTVIAALRLKKRSLQQRLGRRPQTGGNIKSRLTLSRNQVNNNNSSVRGRLGAFRGKRGGPRNGGIKVGTSPMLKARLGGRVKTPFNFAFQQNQRVRFRNQRGNFQNRFRGNRQGNRQQKYQNPRGGRRGGRGGRSGTGGRWNPNTPAKQPTRQELDNQLDEYMAETKSSLDLQLGHYMSQA